MVEKGKISKVFLLKIKDLLIEGGDFLRKSG